MRSCVSCSNAPGAQKAELRQLSAPDLRSGDVVLCSSQPLTMAKVAIPNLIGASSHGRCLRQAMFRLTSESSLVRSPSTSCC